LNHTEYERRNGQLKLGAIADDKPVKLTIELPAAVHRHLVASAEVLAKPICAKSGKTDRTMLERFMATNRAFARSRRAFREATGPRE
jgi:hypothetical protein